MFKQLLKDKIKTNFFNKKIILVMILSFLFSLTFFTRSVYADENETRMTSILGDLVNPVFTIKLSDGDIIVKRNTKRRKINNNISKEKKKEYSLYDRFGPDLKFMTYYGEIKINTNIADKFYSYFIRNGVEVEFTISDIKEFFKNEDYSVNNVVYENRVDVSNSEQDPRYVAWQESVFTGGIDKLSNYYLGLAKLFNEFYMLRITVVEEQDFLDILEKIFSPDFLEILKKTFMPLLVLLIIVFIGNIAKLTIKYFKGNGVGFRKIISTYFVGFLSVTFIIYFITNPLKLTPILTKMTEAKNNLFESTLKNEINNDVIKGSNNTLEATLWYINIFDPWCRATFGKKYEKLYTKQAITEDKKKSKDTLAMSNDNILDAWTDGKKKYSCAQTVGDVKVPKGNGVNVRNWAALAYSVQSIYHIDAIDGVTGSEVWPQAPVCPRNPDIYVDDLRIIDAMLNISEEYTALGETTGNIPMKGKNAPRSYDKSNLVKGGLLALFRSALLTFPIFYFAMKALFYFMQLCFYAVSMVYNSVLFLLKPDKNPFQKTGKDVVNKFISWLIILFMEYSAVYFYAKLYETMLGSLFYIIICIVMIIETPSLTKREYKLKKDFNKLIKDVSKQVVKKFAKVEGGELGEKIADKLLEDEDSEDKSKKKKPTKDDYEDPDFENDTDDYEEDSDDVDDDNKNDEHNHDRDDPNFEAQDDDSRGTNFSETHSSDTD